MKIISNFELFFLYFQYICMPEPTDQTLYEKIKKKNKDEPFWKFYKEKSIQRYTTTQRLS